MQSRGISLQGKDGSVPSFENFKAIEEILRASKDDKHGKTPLAMKEKQEETLKEFMELEKLAHQHPGSLAMVRKLQA